MAKDGKTCRKMIRDGYRCYKMSELVKYGRRCHKMTLDVTRLQKRTTTSPKHQSMSMNQTFYCFPPAILIHLC